MKVLSVKQPWAWFMFADPPALPIEIPRKDIENRTWETNFRGWLLIHASLKSDAGAVKWVQEKFKKRLPTFEVKLGGIIGSIRMTGCVTRSRSPWFQGPYGFVLSDPYPLPFEPCAGNLGIWEYGKS